MKLTTILFGSTKFKQSTMNDTIFWKYSIDIVGAFHHKIYVILIELHNDYNEY